MKHSAGLHHLLDYLPYICHSLWFLSQVSLFLFHVCALFVFLVLYYVFIYSLNDSHPDLASRLPVSSIFE